MPAQISRQHRSLILALTLHIFALQTIAVAEDDRSVDTSGQRLITKTTDAAIERGLKYLASRQRADGSFGSAARPMYRANTGVTGLCGLAFLSAGQTPTRGKYRETVSRAVRFLLSQVQQNGLVVNPESVSYGPMYDHGFAILFLAEVYGMSGKQNGKDRDVVLRGVLTKGVQIIVDSQNREGGWRYQLDSDEADISVTVAQVMALRAVRNSGVFVPKAVIDKAVEYVKACQNQTDGGFRYRLGRQKDSDFARSAAAVVALFSAGIYEGQSVEAGVRYINIFRPRPGLFPPPSYYFYGHYYAAQVMWRRGGKDWEAWYPAIRDDLLRMQQGATGAWTNSSICVEYGTAMALITLQMPNQLVPIFER